MKPSGVIAFLQAKVFLAWYGLDEGHQGSSVGFEDLVLQPAAARANDGNRTACRVGVQSDIHVHGRSPCCPGGGHRLRDEMVSRLIGERQLTMRVPFNEERSGLVPKDATPILCLSAAWHV